jgi:hypothetical protein
MPWLSRFKLHSINASTQTFAADSQMEKTAWSGNGRFVLMAVRRRRSWAIDDLIDGVNGLFFARAAAKDKDTRDEVKCAAIVAFGTALGGGFLTHNWIGNADGLAAMTAQHSAKIGLQGGIGRHGRNSSTVIQYDLGARRYRIADWMSTSTGG